MRNKLIALAALLLLAGAVVAQDKTDFIEKQFVRDGDTLLYRVLFPKDFDASKKYPLLMFLHGAGERGNDNQKQLVHGSSLFLKPEIRTQYPAFVVFPQCPKDDYWANANRLRDDEGNRVFTFNYEEPAGPALNLVIQLTDSLRKAKAIDKKRIYAGGLSMGGMGTFELLYRQPKTFAAAFAICGAGTPSSVKEYAKKVDLWVFHGGVDDVVPPIHSEKMVEALKEAGADVKFTLFPKANHNSWDPAFAEPELLPWLFSKSK